VTELCHEVIELGLQGHKMPLVDLRLFYEFSEAPFNAGQPLFQFDRLGRNRHVVGRPAR